MRRSRLLIHPEKPHLSEKSAPQALKSMRQSRRQIACETTHVPDGTRQARLCCKTIGDCQRAIDEFCAQIEARGLDAGEIGIELPAGQARKGCIARFIEHLIDAGVMAPPSPSLPPAPGSLDELSQAYGDWLHHHRGLSAKTISTRQGVLRRFLTFRFGTAPGDLNAIARDDIVAFLDSPDTATGTVGVDYKAMCLRSLFGFLFATGRIRHDLALSVPRVAR